MCPPPVWCGRLSFVGFALVAGQWGAFWVPAAMALGMALWSVPEIEFYLAERYGAQWDAYVARVPATLVPGVW